MAIFFVFLFLSTHLFSFQAYDYAYHLIPQGNDDVFLNDTNDNEEMSLKVKEPVDNNEADQTIYHYYDYDNAPPIQQQPLNDEEAYAMLNVYGSQIQRSKLARMTQVPLTVLVKAGKEVDSRGTFWAQQSDAFFMQQSSMDLATGIAQLKKQKKDNDETSYARQSAQSAAIHFQESVEACAPLVCGGLSAAGGAALCGCPAAGQVGCCCLTCAGAAGSLAAVTTPLWPKQPAFDSKIRRVQNILDQKLQTIAQQNQHENVKPLDNKIEPKSMRLDDISFTALVTAQEAIDLRIEYQLKQSDNFLAAQSVEELKEIIAELNKQKKAEGSESYNRHYANSWGRRFEKSLEGCTPFVVAGIVGMEIGALAGLPPLGIAACGCCLGTSNIALVSAVTWPKFPNQAILEEKIELITAIHNQKILKGRAHYEMLKRTSDDQMVSRVLGPICFEMQE